MSGKSQYLESALLNWMKGTSFPSAPATVYVALFTTAPGDDSGTGAVEVSGNNYSRASITTSSGWSSISGAPSAPAQISNSSTVTFATPSAGWGAIVAVGIYDAATSGNLLYWTTITSQVVISGVAPSFTSGNLLLTDD